MKCNHHYMDRGNACALCSKALKAAVQELVDDEFIGEGITCQSTQTKLDNLKALVNGTVLP